MVVLYLLPFFQERAASRRRQITLRFAQGDSKEVARGRLIFALLRDNGRVAADKSRLRLRKATVWKSHAVDCINYNNNQQQVNL